MKSVGKIIIGALTGVGLLAIVGSVLHLLLGDKIKYLKKEDIDKIQESCVESHSGE